MLIPPMDPLVYCWHYHIVGTQLLTNVFWYSLYKMYKYIHRLLVTKLCNSSVIFTQVTFDQMYEMLLLIV